MDINLEVIDSLFISMEELAKKLEISLTKNKFEETSKIKREILEIQKKIASELK